MLYLTNHQPGIGGQLKVEPEDFFVEEIPLYSPSGAGQHVYVKIEKRGISTHVARKVIARALHISPNAIGYAGLKDAHAVTRQTLSIDRVDPKAVALLELPNIKILSIARHHNKLKVGHLAGNRFVIKVRGVTSDSLPTAETTLSILAEKGVPNFFGEQRFGNRANTHKLGEALVRKNVDEFVAEYLGRPQPNESASAQAARQLVDEGRWEEALAQWPNALSDERRALASIARNEGKFDDVFRVLDRKSKSFFVSAFQSELFNQLLAQRLNAINQLQQGDVAYLHTKGAAFIVEDPAIEQPRVDNFEISPAGPLFGPKMLLAQGEPGRHEQAILIERNLSKDDFGVPGVKIRGARRPYRFKLKLDNVGWNEGLLVSFELPPGAYATTVMAEVMKP